MNRLLLLSALLASTSAFAVPSVFSHQGRLLDSTGTALEGPTTVTFTLYDASASGTLVWTETQSLDLDNGYFSATLGDLEDIDPDDFDVSGQLYLGIAVNGGAELPQRVALTSVPWALRAEVATSVSGGEVNATSISINGTQVISGDGTINYSAIAGAPDPLADLGCTDGQVVSFAAGNATCADAVTADEIEQSVASAITTHTDAADAHHARYADSDAVAAMGSIGDTNALNHARYADSEAVAAMGSLGDTNALNHDRYTDANAVSAVEATTIAWSASDNRGDWVSCSRGNTVLSGHVQMNKVDFNVGGAYDSATGGVKAPVDGVYMLCLNFLHGQAGDDYANLRLVVNDQMANGGGNDHFLYDTNDYGTWHFMHACQMVELKEGDVAHIQAHACDGFYENPDNNHERFYGFKL